MLSASLRARLSRIARGDACPPAEPPSEVIPGPEARLECEPPRPWALDYDPVASGSEVRTASGAAWRVDLLLPGLRDDRSAPAAATAAPRRVCLDIETAGLASAPLFLVGLLWSEGAGARLVQLVARDYAEEAVVLELAGELLAAAQHWVTYNGGSFDLPYVRDRCAYHRIRPPLCGEHTDLLPLARRQWRGSVANCRLLTVEQEICGRRRLQDVRGDAIPGLYHEFVRTGRWELLAPVLHHNAMDLATTGELWERLGGAAPVRNVRYR